MAGGLSRGRLPRLGLLDTLGVLGAALTLLTLSAPLWYEVNDGVYGAWPFHAWLDVVVAAFCASAAVVPLTRLLQRPAVPAAAGLIATALGLLAIAMLVVRVVAGEPDLFNPSGAELDIAGRGAGVFLCLFLALATLWPVAAAARIRRAGGTVAPVVLRATRPAHWLTALGGLVLVAALSGPWYGTGYSETSGFEALAVIDLALLAVAAAAILAPWIPARALTGSAAAGLVLVIARTIWLPDTGFTNAVYAERLPGLWVALAATVAIAAGATARTRRST